MLTLGLDTATNTASVAVVDATSGRVLSAATAQVAAHSTNLLALVDQALKEANTTLAKIEAFVGGAGPGSFTGIRIGLATIKGLAYVHRKPLWLASSLAATLPHHADPNFPLVIDQHPFVVVLDARRAEVYVGWFRREGAKWVALRDEYVASPATLAAELTAYGKPLSLLGDGAQLYWDALSEALPMGASMISEFATPSAASAVAYALQTPQAARVDALFEGAPTYIRLAEAQVMYPDGLVGVTTKPA